MGTLDPRNKGLALTLHDGCEPAQHMGRRLRNRDHRLGGQRRSPSEPELNRRPREDRVKNACTARSGGQQVPVALNTFAVPKGRASTLPTELPLGTPSKTL